MIILSSMDETTTRESIKLTDDAIIFERKEGAPRLGEIVKALLGMSRVPVAIFVVAHAGLASILALGHMPTFSTILIGVIACFTGTGALIGLNDLMDVDLDRRRLVHLSTPEELDLGSTFIHHPVAKGVISMRMGIIWSGILSIISLYFLSQLRADLWPIFVAIGVSVILYSKLSEVSFIKFLAVASAVTLGALAGWLAVGGPINNAFIIFTVWTFVWEVGGRNIPNDFNDVEEDKPLGIQTIPVVFGPKIASQVVFVALVVTFALSVLLVTTIDFSPVFKIAVPLIGIYVLLIPAYGLLKDPTPKNSMKLYNRSAIYPLLLLAVLMVTMYV